MNLYVLHYACALICCLCAVFTIGASAAWWMIAIPITGTFVNLAIALYLHSRHLDRQRLRGQG